MTTEVIGNGGFTDDGAIIGTEKLQFEAVGIDRPAAEASALRAMFEWCEVFLLGLHLLQSTVQSRLWGAVTRIEVNEKSTMDLKADSGSRGSAWWVAGHCNVHGWMSWQR